MYRHRLLKRRIFQQLHGKKEPPEESSEEMAKARNNLLAGEAAPQDQSPLFSVLPPEVRSHICALALTDYPDPNPDRQYSPETYYMRPSYFAPRKTDTALLRTCKAIYRECWHMPFTLKEQVHWVTSSERAPPEYKYHHLEAGKLGETLERIAEVQGEECSIIDHLRVFAQMWAIEQGDFEFLLRTPRLQPRVITLTIRHTDWWFWESDEPLRFEAQWIVDTAEALSDVTTEIRIELESTKRRKKQIDEIAKKMVDRWSFKKRSGVIMFPDATPGAVEVTEWSGNSTWDHQRWIRDEVEVNKIDYYVATVTFRPEAVLERRNRTISNNARKLAHREDIWHHRVQGTHPMKLDVADPGPLFTGQASLYVGSEMECGTCYMNDTDEEDWDDEDDEHDDEEEYDEEEEEEDEDMGF